MLFGVNCFLLIYRHRFTRAFLSHDKQLNETALRLLFKGFLRARLGKRHTA